MEIINNKHIEIYVFKIIYEMFNVGLPEYYIKEYKTLWKHLKIKWLLFYVKI